MGATSFGGSGVLGRGTGLTLGGLGGLRLAAGEPAPPPSGAGGGGGGGGAAVTKVTVTVGGESSSMCQYE